MFFKSLILGAVCALMAGGAIYYTTLPMTEPALNRSSANPDRASNKFEPQNYGSVEVETPYSAQSKSSPQTESAPYNYEPEQESVQKRSGLREWVDQYLKRKPHNTQTRDDRPPTQSKQAEIKYNNNELAGHNTGFAHADNENITDNQTQNEYIQTHTPPRSVPSEFPSNRPSNAAGNGQRQIQNLPITLSPNVDLNIQTAMREISKISAPVMREQAYFSLVNYALSHARFTQAQLAMNEIGTVEMRETARINMAVALAKNGQSQEAFDMVESIEAPEYRDILRLQVVEALLERKGAQERR